MSNSAPFDSADHINRLESNVADVKRLLSIHEGLGGNAPGRRFDLEVLNKSAVVLLVACWEAYVEDLATSAFDVLLQNSQDPSDFPSTVLTLASRPLRDDNDERRVWELAGSGWRQVLTAHKEDIVHRYIGRLNTPKPNQVNELFEKLIGMSGLSDNWRWHRTNATRAADRLTELVELRGSIAHRVTATQAVKKSTVNSYLDLVYRLSVISNNRVNEFLEQQVGQKPWGDYTFGNTG